MAIVLHHTTSHNAYRYQHLIVPLLIHWQYWPTLIYDRTGPHSTFLCHLVCHRTLSKTLKVSSVGRKSCSFYWICIYPFSKFIIFSSSQLCHTNITSPEKYVDASSTCSSSGSTFVRFACFKEVKFFFI